MAKEEMMSFGRFFALSTAGAGGLSSADGLILISSSFAPDKWPWVVEKWGEGGYAG